MSTALRRSWRRVRRVIRPHASTAIIYHPRYATASSSLPIDPLRAERILAFLAAEALIARRQVRTPRPASLKSLARVHDHDYLETLNEPAILAHVLGSTVTHEQIDRLLDHQRLMVGGTKLATHLALARHGLAINLGGGFHHAHRDHGEGFCVWNDVAVAIAEARSRGFDGRVLVIDLDLHDGNGTRAVFADDPDVHTFSIHARHWGPTEAIASTAIALGPEVDDSRYLDALRSSLPPVVHTFRPELVFYVAGVDVAHDDRLGDWDLSPRGVLARDRLVLDLIRGRTSGRGRRLPLVITLAGGYGAEAWRYNARCLALALNGQVVEPPTTEAMTLQRFRHLSRLLDPYELSGARDDNFGITEQDLALPGWGLLRETRLLGFYTKHGLELVLEKAGLLERLRDLGYSHPSLELDLKDTNRHGLRIWGGPEHDELLAEVRLGHDRRAIPTLTLLAIEWMQLQNPRASFGAGHGALPGQDNPGLGMGHEAVALCAVAAERLHDDGVVWTPAYFHTAGPWQDVALPIDVRAAAQLRALVKLSQDTSFEVATQAVHNHQVVDRATDTPVTWQPSPMVLPLSRAAKKWAQQQQRAIESEPLPDLVWHQPPPGSSSSERRPT